MLTSTDVEVRKPPCEEEIRAQLHRIVTSTEFPNVGRGAAFLSYIVEESLAGNANRIKGYSIALEVFKRDVNFTQDDPVVRIQAGRLRRVLERYYLTAGRTDPIRIDIPKGGYAPVFTWSAPPSPELDGEQTEPAHWAMRYLPPNQEWWSPGWRTISGIAAAAFILFGGAYWVSTLPSVAPATETTVIGPDVPTIVIAPFADLGEGPQAKLYTLGLTEELLTTLPRFKEITVFGRETSNSLTPDADIIITSTKIEQGPQYSIRITDWKTGIDVVAADYGFKNTSDAKQVGPEALPDIDDLPDHFAMGEAK